jgi:iron complex outermembrane receptor protein
MKSFLFALCFGIALSSMAQNKIAGTITNKDHSPIPNVNVVLAELHLETTSNSEGKYSFSEIPTGKWTILFSLIGYAQIQKTIQLTHSYPTLDITLEDQMVHMDEVIVSTAFHKIQAQNVMKVEHETLKSLQQKGTATLIEGLATIPGVSQVATGTSIGKPVIRGLSGNRVLVYSQGVRLENQQFGEEHGLGLNDAGVESVEVIKGPASLLYGSDALGGVLYFNPEKFGSPNSFSTDFGQRFFSNTLGSNTTLGLKTSTAHWKFLTRGSFNTHADYQIPTGNRVTNTRFNEGDLKAGIGYSNAHYSTILRYNFNQLDLGIPEMGIDTQTTSHATTFPRQAVYNHILSLHNTFYLNYGKLEADLGYIANDRSEFTETNTPSLHMKLHTINYDVKYYFPKWDNIEAIVGVQGMHQTNANSGTEYLIPNAKTNDIGTFGTINYEWDKNVLQAGLRFDNRNIASEAHGIMGNEGYFEALDKKFESFNASLGYKTDLTEKISARLNIASGFRAPNLAELTSNGVHEGSNRYEIGNANLQNEQNVQTDLNLEYKSTHLELFANGFYNHINNYIFIAPTGNSIDGNVVFDYIQANAKLYGGEAGIHFHPHPLDWLHFSSSFESVIGTKEDGTPLPLIPANKWNNTLRGEFNIKGWCTEGFATLNIENTWAQNRYSAFETSTRDYTLLNLGLGGKITAFHTVFQINLNANNLFNKTYTSHLSRLKSDGIPNMGRNIVLGFSCMI